jgi:hypothetical protein
MTLVCVWQLMGKCGRILTSQQKGHLSLEFIGFCRELMKVASATLQPNCYVSSALAMMDLQKLDDAEEILHEGLGACRQEKSWIPRVRRVKDAKEYFDSRFQGSFRLTLNL